MLTVGVEEEYLLLDSDTGCPVPRAEAVRSAAGLDELADRKEVQRELLKSQIEIATPVCESLDEVGGHLLRLRHAVRTAAVRNGCLTAACGTPPLRGEVPVELTEKNRYRAMRLQAPQLVEEQLVNGMHVHVGIPSPEAGLAVLNRIRVWLPLLVALSANSPLWDGADTGFASWRTVIYGRWPVAGLPPAFDNFADYQRRVKNLLATGVISDTGQLYWQARLSDHYPTLEVRCTDVQLQADEAVMLAGVIRALVDTALKGSVGPPRPECSPELLRASMWQAARYGMSGPLTDPTGVTRPAGEVLSQLMELIGPALDAAGDTREVTSLLERLLREGTGAERQRRALATGGIRGAVDLVTGESGETGETGGSGETRRTRETGVG